MSPSSLIENHPLDKEASYWIEQHIGAPIEQVEVVAGGKNNQALKVKAKDKGCFFKQYFADDSQRFQRETDFLSLLNQYKVDSVAELIASEQLGDREFALFSILPGEMPTSEKSKEKNKEKSNKKSKKTSVTSDRIQQAANFVAQINRPEVHQAAKHILPARGGLATPQAFIDEIINRTKSFQGLREGAREKEELALINRLEEFLNGEFQTAFQKAVSAVEDYFSEHIQQPLPKVLSSSDFGFHNTLFDSQNNKLYFFDFEYAGWDSAEKLITDFFAQPRFTIDPAQMENFIQTAFPAREDLLLPNLVKHCQVLLPLAHLKWALIFLNDFKHHDSQRRAFASEHQQNEKDQLRLADKERQLLKAQQRIKDLL